MTSENKIAVGLGVVSGLLYWGYKKLNTVRENPEMLKSEPLKSEPIYTHGMRKINDDVDEVRYLTKSKAAKTGDNFIVEGLGDDPDRLFEREPSLDKKSGASQAYVGPKIQYERTYRISQDKLIDMELKFHPEKVMKAILKKFGGKKDGKSKTTDSTYGRLKNGERIRVSSHPIYTRRSESEISVVFDWEREVVRVNTEMMQLSLDTKMSEVVDLVGGAIKELKA